MALSERAAARARHIPSGRSVHDRPRDAIILRAGCWSPLLTSQRFRCFEDLAVIGSYLEVALLASFCTVSSEYLALCERMWEQPGVHSGRIDKSKRAVRRTCNSFAPRLTLIRCASAHEQVLLACFDCRSYVRG